MLPYGIQSTQVHLNYMNDNSFLRFEKFIIKNKSRILEFEEVLNSLDNGIISKFTRAATEKTLKLLRM